jgi:hypothetical protein
MRSGRQQSVPSRHSIFCTACLSLWTLPVQTRAKGMPPSLWKPPPAVPPAGPTDFRNHFASRATTRDQQPCKESGRSRAPRDQDRTRGPQFRGMPGSRASPSLRYNENAAGGVQVNGQASCPLSANLPTSARGSRVEGASPSLAGFVSSPDRCRSLPAILLLGSKGWNPWPWFPKGHGSPFSHPSGVSSPRRTTMGVGPGLGREGPEQQMHAVQAKQTRQSHTHAKYPTYSFEQCCYS